MMLIDAGTGLVPELTARPNSTIPSLVLLTPNARGSLHDMREIGFRGLSGQAGAAILADHAPAMAPRRAGRGAAGQSSRFRSAANPRAVPGARHGARAARGKGLRILLAEDNPINMMLIRELLRRRGHSVTEVTTGHDAVEAVLEGSFDLLLTDIHMPGMDGVEAARAIRAGEARLGKARTPIVALTADALEGGERTCRDAGMDGFLTKPVDPAELEEIFAMLFPRENIVAA